MSKGRDHGIHFERRIARMLDKWWPIEDGFWRSQSSGARATKRKKGQFGDIASTHPDTDWFTRMFCIECKTREILPLHALLRNSKQDGPFKWWAEHLHKTPHDRYPILLFVEGGKTNVLAFMIDESADVLDGWDVMYRHLEGVLLVDFRELLKKTRPEQWRELHADYHQDLERG